jgi:hypothetical protein
MGNGGGARSTDVPGSCLLTVYAVVRTDGPLAEAPSKEDLGGLVIMPTVFRSPMTRRAEGRIRNWAIDHVVTDCFGHKLQYYSCFHVLQLGVTGLLTHQGRDGFAFDPSAVRTVSLSPVRTRLFDGPYQVRRSPRMGTQTLVFRIKDGIVGTRAIIVQPALVNVSLCGASWTHVAVDAPPWTELAASDARRNRFIDDVETAAHAPLPTD